MKKINNIPGAQDASASRAPLSSLSATAVVVTPGCTLSLENVISK